MQGPTNESVGEKFQVDLLVAARNKTLQVITEAATGIRPGMTESDGSRLVQEIQKAMGAPKSWHAPQIRFGENTLLPFGQRGREDLVLKDEDIFFFDIGPIFDGHEGDVGRPFALGKDKEMHRCCADAETIWHEVRNHWVRNSTTGEMLYRFAKKSAADRGWQLLLQKANGHRISDFPHAARFRGSIEQFNQHLTENRWILEIQIRHPIRPFGAFFEDLLN